LSWLNEKTLKLAKAFSEMRNAVYKEGALEVGEEKAMIS